MRLFLSSLVVLLSLTIPACRPPQGSQPTWTSTASGLGIRDLVVGTGAVPRQGQTCVVEAVGWIEGKGTQGKPFFDSRKRGYPNVFPLGMGRVIKGWDEGVASMRQGGKRLVRVPPSLGYTAMERGQDIPEGATLIFELELVELK